MDNFSLAKTSTAVSVTVKSTNVVPSVSIAPPSSGTVFTAPASIALTANAADSDGTITKVDFYNGTTLLGTTTSAPFNFSWSNVAAGNYSLTAKATDNSNGATTAAAINLIVNAPPSINITLPNDGAEYTAPATVSLAADAADSDGTISKVDFFNGTTLIGTATNAPYTLDWNSVAAGNYSLSAKATDNSGATTTSSAISISVKAPPNGTE